MHDSDSAMLRIALFAGMADLVGHRDITVPWTGGTVGDLRRAIGAAYPGLAALLSRSAIARGAGYVADDVDLVPGDDVAIIPPVSGG